MDNSFHFIPYIFKGLLRSFLSFFSDWYLFIPQLYWKKVFWFFRDLDKGLALKAMVQNWFSPLYQDYNIAGFFIGVIIRTGWIIFDLIFYAFFFIIATLIFIFWLSIPPGILWFALLNLIS